MKGGGGFAASSRVLARLVSLAQIGELVRRLACKSKRVLGLVEMTCELVHASHILPEWQAVKLTFFAPRILKITQLQTLDFKSNTQMFY